MENFRGEAKGECRHNENEKTSGRWLQVQAHHLQLVLPQRGFNTKRGPRTSFISVPRNLSNQMDKQARTGDTVCMLFSALFEHRRARSE
jgi:hypothetical protein